MAPRFIDSLKNPKISGFQWQDAEDEADRKTFKDILEYGCQVISVEGDENTPYYSYSVGLYLNFLQPEILLVGISGKACLNAINKICAEAAVGKKLEGNDVRADLFTRPLKFVAVEKKRYFDYLGYAAWFYRSLLFNVYPPMEHKFPVLHGIWPDKDLVYPDENRCDAYVRRIQTLVPLRKKERT